MCAVVLQEVHQAVLGPQLEKKSSNGVILVGRQVVGFTRRRQAFLVDSTGHHDLPVVDDGSEHGSGGLHGRQLPPLRLLVVVSEHLVEGFAVEMKGGAMMDEQISTNSS